ncbi:hypothetical protein [Steroidobacter cummioxidans]|uniref:hypothetical protein n=1 Tax=Steroidobacter cummioxidans TaxID=1803913 RepID=UPI000E3158DB|nr:hypothetical protein [Steroidobacter cummioxidans]
MKELLKPSSIVPFIAAVAVATIWGAVVQTQYNLAGLSSIGADISSDVRVGATLSDIFSGFSPTYGSHIVLPSLLVAFVVASLLPVQQRVSRLVLFAAAGALAIGVGIPIVNWLAPVALLVGASRDVSCTILMALGGLVAGLLFASLPLPRLPRGRREHPTALPVGSHT